MRKALLVELNGVKLHRIELTDEGRIFEVMDGDHRLGAFANISEALRLFDELTTGEYHNARAETI